MPEPAYNQDRGEAPLPSGDCPIVSCRFPVRVLVAVSSVLSVACAAQPTPSPAPSPRPPVVHGDAAAIERARLDSARLPYTAADIHFMTGMIAHHAQAIQMAQMAPEAGASSSIRVLAERIINAQRDEIHTMQQWLADRRQPVPEAKPGPMRMVMNGMEHEMLMPGMLTEPELARLAASRGREFDERFLRAMIAHHQGAVTMVRDLFATDGAGQDELVFKFASDVHVDQTTEIARMERMLATILFEGRAP